MPDSERSAAEREAARLERARRRAAAAGRMPGDDAAEPVRAAPSPRPADGAAEPVRAAPSRASGDGAAESAQAAASRPSEDATGESVRSDPETGAIREPYDDDTPIGIRRVSHRERVGGARDGRAAALEDGHDERGSLDDAPGGDGAAGAAGARREPRAPSRGRRGRSSTPPPRNRRPARPASPGRRWLGRAIALVPLLLAAALIWFLVELYQPFHGSPHGRVAVVIPAHSSSTQIGDLLASRGVVPSGFFFDLRAMLSGDRGKLRSGTYHLQLGMTYGSALKVLTTPPPAAKVSELTLIEGLTRRQIDSLLRHQGIRGDYVVATRHSRLLASTRYGAPRSTPSLEGFLFPSTYQLRDPITVDALVAKQLSTFRQEFAKVKLSYAASKHLTAYDVLIIASMVQAEAQTSHDRPLIASVIYNRLRLGMPLQIDATTRYATGNYSRPLTISELKSPSPYNTRIHRGLPPTPIDNPGLAAIQAAANPAHTNYLYFVAKPCGNGAHVFASNYKQFLHEAAAYQSARTAHGGRSPERC